MSPSSATAILVSQLLFYVLLGAGWFANLYKLATYAESTGKTALRIIGVIIGPIGGVMGWF